MGRRLTHPLVLAGLLLAQGLARADASPDQHWGVDPNAGQTVVTTDAGPIEILTWQGVPLPLVLPVNQDRVVRFPNEVRLGPPSQLTNRLQVTSADGAVYLRALAEFEPTLVLVQETQAPARTFALQLSAKPEGSTKPVDVVAPSDQPTATRTPAPPTPSAEITTESPPPQRLGYVALTRFAAQQVYAPPRLRRLMEGVYQTAVPVGRRVPLIRAASALGPVEAVPLGSWTEEGGLHVTAIRLRNRSRYPIELDPRTALRGRWLAATFQHYRLLPAGHPADTSTVYVVSHVPFNDALGIVGGRR